MKTDRACVDSVLKDLLISCRRTIYAWPLEAPESQFREDPHTQHFPHTISDVTVRGNRAGLVLFNNEIYIWHIGQLKNPSSKVTYPSESGLYSKFHRRQLAVILHPSKASKLIKLSSSDCQNTTTNSLERKQAVFFAHASPATLC